MRPPPPERPTGPGVYGGDTGVFSLGDMNTAISIVPAKDGSYSSEDLQKVVGILATRTKSLQRQLDEQRQANEADRQARRDAELRLEGAREEKARQQADAEKAEKAREKQEARRFRYLTAIFTVVGMSATAFAYMAGHYTVEAKPPPPALSAPR